MSTKKTKKTNLTDILRIAVLVLSSLVFVASAIYLLMIYIPSDKTPNNPIDSNDLFDDFDNKKDEFLEYVRSLKTQNDDMWGYINVYGTKIDYPVLFYKDNEFYLKHNFYKQKDRHGALFVDTYTNMGTSKNWVIYGHNMGDGTMFRGLHKFTSKKYYDEHKTLAFSTMTETGIYDIFAVVSTQIYPPGDPHFAYYDYVNIDSKKDYDTYVQNMKNLSAYDTGITPKYGQQLITMSTCIGTSSYKRLVVVACKRLEPYPNPQ